MMYGGISDPSAAFGAGGYQTSSRGNETKIYRLTNGKYLSRYVNEPVRLIGLFKGLEDNGFRLIFTTTDGVTVSCSLARSVAQDAATQDRVVVVCGVLSSVSPPQLAQGFFTPLGNELNAEQADEVVAVAHHDFFSPFYPPSATDAAVRSSEAR
ncbi:replication factor a protein 3 protein [Besnoitia besnoiti]|uniref:Replication factor a protein 3 protein n=1 Tax=Besnoitia besnoiti TaxID=94643 RepID=A0A2A9MMS4_BESBE|nr:replication factor a protein 3 protein [Besnoitia besnoiti]PFH37097.1 replication factor a protein 3 protein [Besnoitia besnoiti]